MEKYFVTKLGFVVNGDALAVMEELIEMGMKFDAVIADIPQKITTDLISSNRKDFKYMRYWKKIGHLIF